MIPISEVGLSAPQTHQPQSQAALIPSVMAEQKVVAAQSSAASGGAGGDDPNPQKHAGSAATKLAGRNRGTSDQIGQSAQSQSIVEAQDAAIDDKIKAAFALQHNLDDLLSVIRDPEDQILPDEPVDLSD